MPVVFPEGFSIAQLQKSHNRSAFNSGEHEVDEWLKSHARQAQSKHLSVTRVLLDTSDKIAGYYTLAMGQVHFDELPHELSRKMPSTMMPIITLAWLGIDKAYQKQGLGEKLLAQALKDCHDTGLRIPFIAVILDCLNKTAKSFYQKYDFSELPGHPMKLMLPWNLLDKISAE